MNHPEVNQISIQYQENGVDKTMSQEDAILLVERISARDPQRGLHFFHKFCSDNPSASKLRWAFYSTLANLFLFDQLLQVCNEVLSKDTSEALSLIWKVEALRKMSRHSEAIALLEKMVAGDKSDYQTLTKLGVYHKQIGNFDKAVWCFNRAIEQNHYFTAPYWLRSDICDAPEENLAALQALIASDNCPQDQQHYLHFAAYRYAERLTLYEEAFQHLQLANAYTRRTFDYDINDELNADNDAIELFTEKFLARYINAVDTEVQPVFIIGLPRSGTSLVEKILSSHSEVSAGGDNGALENAIKKAQTMSKSSGSALEWFTSRHQADWQWIGNAYQANIRFQLKGNRIVTDKTLSNSRLVGVIKLALPNAKIISVERNSLDLGFGIYRQLFEPSDVLYGYTLEEIAKRLGSHQVMMAHWATQFGSSMLSVQYEDLVKSPKSSIDSMLDFCGLVTEPNCYRAENSISSENAMSSENTISGENTIDFVNTLSTRQVREPIFQRGIDRWQTYKDPLLALQRMLGNP